jgi:hypothetical protein
MMNERRIGEMNGKWAVLLRFGLATYPFVLAASLGFSVWVVQGIFRSDATDERMIAISAERESNFRERLNATVKMANDAYTAKDAAILESKLEARVDAKISLTQQMMVAKIETMSRDLTEIKISLAKLAAEADTERKATTQRRVP